MNEYFKEIKEIAARCTMSQSDGYSLIMRICEEHEEHDDDIYNRAIDDFVKIAKEHNFRYGKKDITNCVIGFIEFFAEQLKEDKNE